MNKGDLGTKPHPMAHDAQKYIADNFTFSELCVFASSFASCAIEGNSFGEVCGETLRRLMENEPVSDRYILGLAWFLRNAKEAEVAE